MKPQFSRRTLVIVLPLLFAIGWGTNLIDGRGMWTPEWKWAAVRIWRVTASVDGYTASLHWAKGWYHVNKPEQVVKRYAIGWPSRNLYPDNCELVRIRRYTVAAGSAESPCQNLFIDIVIPF